MFNLVMDTLNLLITNVAIVGLLQPLSSWSHYTDYVVIFFHLTASAFITTTNVWGSIVAQDQHGKKQCHPHLMFNHDDLHKSKNTSYAMLRTSPLLSILDCHYQ
jgi:hypothetical protein